MLSWARLHLTLFSIHVAKYLAYDYLGCVSFHCFIVHPTQLPGNDMSKTLDKKRVGLKTDEVRMVVEKEIIDNLCGLMCFFWLNCQVGQSFFGAIPKRDKGIIFNQTAWNVNAILGKLADMYLPGCRVYLLGTWTRVSCVKTRFIFQKTVW